MQPTLRWNGDQQNQYQDEPDVRNTRWPVTAMKHEEKYTHNVWIDKKYWQKNRKYLEMEMWELENKSERKRILKGLHRKLKPMK